MMQSDRETLARAKLGDVLGYREGSAQRVSFMDGNMIPIVFPSDTIAAALAFSDAERLAQDGDSGWIVGNGDGTQWRTWGAFGSEWTDDRNRATRYPRREVAEAVHESDEDAWRVLPFAALSSDAVRVPDAPTPALHEGGRFAGWSSADLAAQCLSQAREQLDPEFSQFMTAVAQRLAASPTSPSLAEGEATGAKSAPVQIPAGMVPWHGGDSAPDDWDGGPVWFRRGRLSDGDTRYENWSWREDGDTTIIAYTRSGGAK